ncbi:MAG TPA: hypothetical protein VHA52_00610 [Candidatus Babeliaceae bacterium]|nr:hypothetical protein [Candidatus Babeliaceae bacterium]
MKRLFFTLSLLAVGVSQAIAVKQPFIVKEAKAGVKAEDIPGYKYIAETTPIRAGAPVQYVYGRVGHNYKAIATNAGVRAKAIPGYKYIGHTKADKPGAMVLYIYEEISPSTNL